MSFGKGLPPLLDIHDALGEARRGQVVSSWRITLSGGHIEIMPSAGYLGRTPIVELK